MFISNINWADLDKICGIDFNPAAELKSMLWWIEIISAAGIVLGPPVNPGSRLPGRAEPILPQN
jgi:hypothetical protein